MKEETVKKRAGDISNKSGDTPLDRQRDICNTDGQIFTKTSKRTGTNWGPFSVFQVNLGQAGKK